MTTQIPRNQPKPPREVQGPASMPRIRPAVHHQPTPAAAKSASTSSSRVRTAAYAGDRPRPAAGRAGCRTVMRSGGPGEVRVGDARLALVLDAEGVDARPLR